jgi:hypothetical protein
MRSCGGNAPKRIENWSLTSLRQRLVKRGGRQAKQVHGHLTGRQSRLMVRRSAASASGVDEGRVSWEVNEGVVDGKVSAESGDRAAVAGHGVLGRSRMILSELPGRHSGERDEPQRLHDTPIVVC